MSTYLHQIPSEMLYETFTHLNYVEVGILSYALSYETDYQKVIRNRFPFIIKLGVPFDIQLKNDYLHNYNNLYYILQKLLTKSFGKIQEFSQIKDMYALCIYELKSMSNTYGKHLDIIKKLCDTLENK